MGVKLSGVAGDCTYGAGPTTIKITAWSLVIDGEVLDVTDSGDTTWKEFLPGGYTSWAGSFEGFVETGDAGGQTIGAAAGNLTLLMDATRKWAGTAILTQQSTGLTVVGGEAVKVAYTFQGTGTLTPTNAA